MHTTLEKPVLDLGSARDDRSVGATNIAAQEAACALAHARHDLRQPFQALGFFIHLLGKRVTDPKGIEYLTKLAEAAAQGEALAVGAVDLAAIAAASEAPEPEAIDLDALLGSVMEDFDQDVSTKGLSLAYYSAAAVVRADAKMLRRAVVHLLGHWCRGTPSGRLIIGCRRRTGAVEIQIWSSASVLAPPAAKALGANGGMRTGERAGLDLDAAAATLRLLGLPLRIISLPGGATMAGIRIPLAFAAR